MKNKKIKYNKNPIELITFIFIASLILMGLFLYFYKLEAYKIYVEEDSFIEYLTAFLLLGLAAICFLRGLKAGKRKHALFYFSCSLLFFFGGGEEISWGQRILGYNTPDGLKSLNTQGEFTLHNIRLFGVKLNKLIFGTILYSSVISYFFLFPVLYQRKRKVRYFVNSFYLPVPKPWQSTAYFIFFFLLYIIPEGFKKWEMQEFALSAHLFLSFLFPSNQQSPAISVESQEWPLKPHKAWVGKSPKTGLKLKNRLPQRKSSKKEKRNRRV